LEGRAIRCWMAPRDVLPGAQWAEAIMDAIEATRVMVVVCSAHTNASPQVAREVERAVNAGSIIIPFRIEDVPFTRSLTFFLSSGHWLDALTPPLEAHIDRLAETVGRNLGRTREVDPQRPDGGEAGAAVFQEALSDAGSETSPQAVSPVGATGPEAPAQVR